MLYTGDVLSDQEEGRDTTAYLKRYLYSKPRPDHLHSCVLLIGTQLRVFGEHEVIFAIFGAHKLASKSKISIGLFT